MAQTISQFIDMIRTKRDNEMAQRLQGLIPLLDQKIEMERAEQEKVKAREQAYGGIGVLQGQYGYTPEETEQFKAETAGMPTETLGKYFDTYNAARTAKQELVNMGVNITGTENPYALGNLHSVSKQAMGLGEEGFKSYLDKVNQGIAPEVAYASVTATLNAKTEESKFQQKLRETEAIETIRDRHQTGSGRGGGGSGGKTAVNEQYRVKLRSILKTDADGTHVLMYHGGVLRKLPAKVGSDGRLYLVGEKGLYEANPYDYPDYDKESSPNGVIKKSKIDEWNGAGGDSGTNTTTEEEKKNKGKSTSLPPGVGAGW